MSDSNNVSRRSFLQRLGALGVAGVGAGTVLSACGGDDAAPAEDTADADFSCDDLSGLSDQEIQTREQQVQALQYVEETPNPDELCSNCAFWQEAEAGSQCGGCDLFPGPVHPDGWCNSWVAAS